MLHASKYLQCGRSIDIDILFNTLIRPKDNSEIAIKWLTRKTTINPLSLVTSSHAEQDMNATPKMAVVG